MIQLEEIEQIHKTLTEFFRGAQGIRDLSALQSALTRPVQTFDNKDLHPNPIYKAAALTESILINHPFIDGNKRTGYVAMRNFPSPWFVSSRTKPPLHECFIRRRGS